MVTFTVYGDPKGKGRPRFANGHAYTPETTRIYEKRIQLAYRQQSGGYMFPADEPIDIRVMVYMAIPKSASKKKQGLMRAHKLRPVKRPDFDNIAKIVADSLNGVAYHDDAQVVDAMTRKFYADEPRVVVTIRPAQLGE